MLSVFDYGVAVVGGGTSREAKVQLRTAGIIYK
jgi:hypothetical protein